MFDATRAESDPVPNSETRFDNDVLDRHQGGPKLCQKSAMHELLPY